jgi:hypothetical protein
MALPAADPFVGVSRAALRLVLPGNDADCAQCSELIKFSAHDRGQRQAIANVYTAARWSRVEFFHEACYLAAQSPYGLASPARPVSYPSKRPQLRLLVDGSTHRA